jgi:hypothetical protein
MSIFPDSKKKCGKSGINVKNPKKIILFYAPNMFFLSSKYVRNLHTKNNSANSKGTIIFPEKRGIGK